MDSVKDFSVSPSMPVKKLQAQYAAAGFQASELARASDLLSEMFADKSCTRFLAFTSNLMASGLRGLLIELARQKRFDAVITAGGALDHDILRSYRDYQLGSFHDDDKKLHARGVNRLGNLQVPNAHYVFLEKWIAPLYAKMYASEKVFAARQLSSVIGARLAAERKDSFLAACYRNGIPVFSPGVVDSALGLQLHLFKQDHRDFVLDASGDMRELAAIVLSAKRTGGLVLGGGISKHFTIASNLLRGGLDYAVYVSTAGEFDGSLSGAPPREAQSWGKIRAKAATAFVHADATLALPLLYAWSVDGA